MSKSKLLAATTLLAAIAMTPNLAEAKRHHRHYQDYRSYYGLPYPISYLHNYGPGLAPGTFDYYDGPSTNRCYQGSAAYIGQDGQRHPCF